jgi:hypothetical protein
VVAVVVLLAASGVGYALYVLSGDGEPGVAATTGPGPSASPRDNVGLSAAVAEVGDCLANDGTFDQPQMRIVRCGEPEGESYEVLAVLEERAAGSTKSDQDASAQQICADVEGYTHHYFEVGEQSSFVLCMTEQE